MASCTRSSARSTLPDKPRAKARNCGIARINNNGCVAAEIPAHPLAEEGPVYNRPIAAPAPKSFMYSRLDNLLFIFISQKPGSVPHTSNLLETFTGRKSAGRHRKSLSRITRASKKTRPGVSDLKVDPKRCLHNAGRTSRCRSSKARICLLINRRANIGQRTCCAGVGIDLDQTVCQSTVQIAEVRVIKQIVCLPP